MITTVELAPIEEKPLIANLIELYIYDFSEFMGWDLGEDGRFNYRILDEYWTESSRHPFVIRVDGKIAGFALVRQDDGDDGRTVTSMAEFFVLRKYRKQGVGETAASFLFDRFPGDWHVEQLLQNTAAQRFWRRVIAGYTGGDFSEETTDRHVIQTFEVD